MSCRPIVSQVESGTMTVAFFIQSKADRKNIGQYSYVYDFQCQRWSTLLQIIIIYQNTFRLLLWKNNDIHLDSRQISMSTSVCSFFLFIYLLSFFFLGGGVQFKLKYVNGKRTHKFNKWSISWFVNRNFFKFYCHAEHPKTFIIIFNFINFFPKGGGGGG